ncbi:MAG: GAF domain-containing protein, partial [Syntrophales bacterium]|nr:GAF domain-containing protein [Syntrophales bacterium]
PLITQGKVLGVLSALNKTTGPFTEEDLEMLKTIAANICIALENARLYEESLAMAEKEREIRSIFQRFLPAEIADRIIRGDDAEHPIVEEYRTVTFLNIDIRGFSQATKRMGTQKSVALMNDFFAMMGEIVFEEGGIVDKYLGDGFLALFGVPTAGPADADKAIRSAMAMKRVMPRFNEMCVANYGISLTIGISVHTGEAVVGNVGFHKKMDYTAIGDSVNFVFKLQNLCKSWPNEILISETTLHAAQSSYDVEQVGEFDVDPGTTPHVRIYRLLT